MSNDTLFGSRTISGHYENGQVVELQINQFRLKQYREALIVIEDEISLVALAAGKARGVIEMLHPDTFERAYAALQEVNAKGFFTWSERQEERTSRMLKNLPPDMLEKIIAKGKSLSSMPSPALPPPAG